MTILTKIHVLIQLGYALTAFTLRKGSHRDRHIFRTRLIIFQKRYEFILNWKEQKPDTNTKKENKYNSTLKRLLFRPVA